LHCRVPSGPAATMQLNLIDFYGTDQLRTLTGSVNQPAGRPNHRGTEGPVRVAYRKVWPGSGTRIEGKGRRNDSGLIFSSNLLYGPKRRRLGKSFVFITKSCRQRTSKTLSFRDDYRINWSKVWQKVELYSIQSFFQEKLDYMDWVIRLPWVW
jgi:hypothetical protein